MQFAISLKPLPRHDPGQANEYEFTPSDPAKPKYYGVCTPREAAEHAEQASLQSYRRIK